MHPNHYVKDITAFVIDEFLPDMHPDQLPVDYDLLAGGVIDSLGLLKVIAWLEEHFGISTEEVEISPEDFSSVSAIAGFVSESTHRAGAS